MTLADDCLQGRSQFLSFVELNDKIVIDCKTFDKLRSLVLHCQDELILHCYCDIAPDALEEIVGWLEEAREIISFILAASKLGGGNG
jgi:hypothetical protein